MLSSFGGKSESFQPSGRASQELGTGNAPDPDVTLALPWCQHWIVVFVTTHCSIVPGLPSLGSKLTFHCCRTLSCKRCTCRSSHWNRWDVKNRFLSVSWRDPKIHLHPDKCGGWFPELWHRLLPPPQGSAWRHNSWRSASPKSSHPPSTATICLWRCEEDPLGLQTAQRRVGGTGENGPLLFLLVIRHEEPIFRAHESRTAIEVHWLLNIISIQFSLRAIRGRCR